MTLDELVDFDADQWEKLTDAEITAFFADKFIVTRPELAPRAHKQQEMEPINYALQAKMQKLAALGIDLSGVLPKGKKR